VSQDLTAQHRVIWLIRTRNDAREEWDGRSDGGGVKLMPSAYHEGSYVELERVEALMRDAAHSAWWHVMQRYRFGTSQTLELPVRAKPRRFGLIGEAYDRLGHDLYHLPAHCELAVGQVVSGKKTARVRVYRWDPAVDMTKVRSGVRWLTQAMYDGRRSRIVVPDELYRRLVGLPPRDEKRRREDPVATIAA
jgi:hypothetical protein